MTGNPRTDAAVPDPHFRDQLAEVARRFIVAEVGEDFGPGMTAQAERFADALMPVIAAEVAPDTVPAQAAITPEAIVGWRGDEGRVHDVELARTLAELDNRVWGWRRKQEVAG